MTVKELLINYYNDYEDLMVKAGVEEVNAYPDLYLILGKMLANGEDINKLRVLIKNDWENYKTQLEVAAIVKAVEEDDWSIFEKQTWWEKIKDWFFDLWE